MDYDKTVIINEGTFHSSTFPLFYESNRIEKVSIVFTNQELIVIVNVCDYDSYVVI